MENYAVPSLSAQGIKKPPSFNPKQKKKPLSGQKIGVYSNDESMIFYHKIKPIIENLGGSCEHLLHGENHSSSRLRKFDHILLPPNALRSLPSEIDNHSSKVTVPWLFDLVHNGKFVDTTSSILYVGKPA